MRGISAASGSEDELMLLSTKNLVTSITLFKMPSKTEILPSSIKKKKFYLNGTLIGRNGKENEKEY